jgi:hypothetical protein
MACRMSTDITGLPREELMDGVEIGGVEDCLDVSDSPELNLFVQRPWPPHRQGRPRKGRPPQCGGLRPVPGVQDQ